MIKTKKGVTVGTAAPGMRRFLRQPAVQAATGLPVSSMYALISRGEFPKPIKLSENRVAWLEDEVAEWQAERLAAREKDAA